MTKILLVDDVTVFLELERSFLEGEGFEVVTARNGEEALAGLDDLRPDLVLLDLYMDGMNGDDVCRQVRVDEKWSQLPVLMVTAAGKDEDIDRCLAAGCDDYITKPVNKGELIEKVLRLTGGIKSRTCPRTAVAFPVEISGGGRSLVALATDLSLNGIHLKSQTTLEEGTAIDLKMSLSGGRTLILKGKVKREDREGMGVYFVHPDAEELSLLKELLSGAGPGEPDAQFEPEPIVDEEKVRLLERIEELEKENQEFASRIVRTEELNNNLTNLYIASSRLHSVLDREKVAAIIQEVVINFVGAEKFALLICDKKTRELVYEGGEGFEGEDFPVISPGEGLIGEAFSSKESYYREGSVAHGSDDPLAPIAAIPLLIHGEAIGVIAIYRLFIQKEKFEPVDFQLFSMLAEHAATAIFSSNLYEVSERKRETYQGLMDLLLK